MSDSPTPNFAEHLGNTIAKQRRRRQLSQGQLAKLAGLSLKYVGEIERAEANVSAAVLQRLFEALDWHPTLTVDDLRKPMPATLRELVRGDLRLVTELVRAAYQRLDGDDVLVPLIEPAEPNRRGRPRMKGQEKSL
jgi:transcriptional regulator with XRE-family HTH domain